MLSPDKLDDGPWACLKPNLKRRWGIHELYRLVAVAIASGQPVHRSPLAPPAAVLGVKVADKVSRAA